MTPSQLSGVWSRERPGESDGLDCCKCDSNVSAAALPGNVASPELGELSESFQQRLTQLLCLATDSDQAILAHVAGDGQVQELARSYSLAGGEQNWADWPEPGEIVARVVRQAKSNPPPAVWFGEQSAQAFPGPLLAQPALVGRQEFVVFCLLRLPGRAGFTQREATILQHLAGLWKEFACSEDTRLLAHVRLLRQIAQFGASHSDLRAVLRNGLRELARHLPGTVATVWILDGGPPPRLQLAAYSDLPMCTPRTTLDGRSPDASGWEGFPAELPLETSALAPVIRQRQIVYFDSLAKHPAAELQQWARLGFAVGVALPLTVGSQALGIVVLLSPRVSGLTPVQVQLALAVADILAPFLAWHQLSQRLRQSYEELQKAHQQLANAEKMRALGEMASGMAHDFNNALCGTLGFLELALRDPHLPDNVAELLRMARTCAFDAAATVRRVQDFARLDPGVRAAELVAVNDLVRHVVELTRPRWQNADSTASRTIEVELDLQAEKPVMANPSELREVLTNLIFNAVDAMPQGGRITIATASNSQHVTIRVTDTGIGMPPEVQQHLFEPFFTTKKERGTGLGLSVSYAIVRRHGGQITVESQPGRGSTFTIQLPVPREPIAEVAGSSSSAQSQIPQSLRVLVVDDEPHVLTFIRQCLLHLGHQPETVSDAEQALVLLSQKHYDLLITDLGMPKMNGEQLARQVYQLNPELPVVLLTGWGEQPLQGHTLPTNIRHILAKPITVEQLAQTLRAGGVEHKQSVSGS